MTGGVGDEPGFRAYLARYPDGLFANIAKPRLSEIDDQRRGTAEAADRAAWSIAQSEDIVAGYQEYLAAYPSGVFAPQAGLRLSGVRAQLLELRLRDLGYNPGRLDGVIDDNTRNAIVYYQEAEGLIATGYVDRATAVGLMTGSITITVPGR